MGSIISSGCAVVPAAEKSRREAARGIGRRVARRRLYDRYAPRHPGEIKVI